MIQRIAAKKFLFKLGFALLIAVLTYGVAYLLTPRYKSKESLYFPISGGASSQGSLSLARGAQPLDPGTTPSLGGGLYFPLVGTSQRFATGLIKSGSIHKEITKQLNLPKRLKLKEGDCMEILANRLSVNTNNTSGFLEISIEMESPVVARDILLCLNQVLAERFDSLTASQGRKNREFLERKAAEARKKLEEKQDQFIQLVAASPDSNYQAIQDAYFRNRLKQQESAISLEAAKAQRASTIKQVKSILAQSGTPESKLTAIASATANLENLSEQLQVRHLALLDAMSKYKPDSVEAKEAKRAQKTSQDFVNKMIDQELKNVSKGLTPTLTTLNANIASLEKTISEYSVFVGRLKSQFEKAAGNYAFIQRANSEFDLALRSWTTLQTELENAKILEVRDPARFEVIDAPGLSKKPSYPRKARTALIVFGFVFLLLWIPNLIQVLKAQEQSPGSTS